MSSLAFIYVRRNVFYLTYLQCLGTSKDLIADATLVANLLQDAVKAGIRVDTFDAGAAQTQLSDCGQRNRCVR